ncbi:MAG: hypothetical protein ACREEO_08150, partial [Phenylobacterium sp.]
MAGLAPILPVSGCMEPGLKQIGTSPLPLSQIISQRGLIAALAATCGLAVILLACANPRYTDGSDGRSQGLAQVARTFSERGLTRLTADMDPAMLALAKRHDPLARQADPWGRTIGWTSLDISKIPDLGLDTSSVETAEEINALRAFSKLPIRPMRPFVLHAGGQDAGRAQ